MPPNGGHTYTAPAVGDGKVYVGTASGTNAFYALDEANGKVVWKLVEEQGFDGYPLLVGDTILAGANASYLASLYALDARSGKIQWQFQGNDGVITRPTLARTTVIVAARDGGVYGINALSGKVTWHSATGDQSTTAMLPTGAAAATANGVVFVGSESRVVAALNATTGAVIWKQSVDGSVDSAPSASNGAVYVTTEKGSVYALRASDGALGWHYVVGGLIYASPVTAPHSSHVGLATAATAGHHDNLFSRRARRGTIAADPGATHVQTGAH